MKNGQVKVRVVSVGSRRSSFLFVYIYVGTCENEDDVSCYAWILRQTYSLNCTIDSMGYFSTKYSPIFSTHSYD